MSETATAEKFEGRAGQMRDSRWLAVEDIDGLPDVEVTIEEVLKHKGVKMPDGKVKNFFTLKFVGRERQLILSAEARKTLVAHFGLTAKDWASQKVKLYVKEGVKAFGGGTTKGVRIR